MMTVCRIFLVAFLLVFAQPINAEQLKYPETQEALEKAFAELNWEGEPKQYTLTSSHGRYRLPEGLAIVRDDDARLFLFLNNGVEFPSSEAVVFDPDSGEQLVFTYFEQGYVRDDDWGNLDNDLLLEGISESTEEGNQERVKNGFEPMHVVGWAQEPTYDKSSRVAYWAIKAKEANGFVINAKAIKLGRRGHSELIWVGDPEQFTPLQGLLREAVDNHEFDQGYRYADFSAGDTVAAVGIASLVATAAGSKGGKGVVAGLLATLLIFAKKLWVLVFVAAAGVWAAVKRLFKRT
jgi:uncharacterized membrane-anchored protein